MSGAPKVRGPAPTDAELLRLFVELAGEYDRLSAVFPVSVSSAELLESTPTDLERWNRTVRALALRKFVLGAQDAVRVDRVIDACHRSLVYDDPGVQQAARAFAEIAEGIGTSIEVVEGVLYGNLLHGEYERHQRNKARHQDEMDLAVWLFGESTEFLVRNLRNSLIVAARTGRLNEGASQAINATYGPSPIV